MPNPSHPSNIETKFGEKIKRIIEQTKTAKIK